MQLKFASYNIHKGVGLDGRRDPERILAVLREVDADIIALQEVDMRLGERASVIQRSALDDTPWRAAPVARRPRSLGWHGNALLVRRGMEIVSAEALDLPTLEPRGAAGVVVKVEGQSIRVIGTHLDLSGLRRRDQVRALLGHIATAQEALPTVIMGDFNQWGRMTGAMREFGPNWQVISPGRSFPSRRPLARLDRIVASADWAVEEHGVHHSRLAAVASDHLPVEAAFTLHNN
ncbi:endonuclease/exonuclease/phosphatase family protein [Qipengyuania sp. DGS5-3]|uniref:endonuclease/exonuclease/phosphatase family protein n=1 Tax=Qipengyuania sp. DGS5-3 TaxID=3349632 RepID=UPI0036D2BA89